MPREKSLLPLGCETLSEFDVKKDAMFGLGTEPGIFAGGSTVMDRTLPVETCADYTDVFRVRGLDRSFLTMKRVATVENGG